MNELEVLRELYRACCAWQDEQDWQGGRDNIKLDVAVDEARETLDGASKEQEP